MFTVDLETVGLSRRLVLLPSAWLLHPQLDLLQQLQQSDSGIPSDLNCNPSLPV